jgi:hypothetical protein
MEPRRPLPVTSESRQFATSMAPAASTNSWPTQQSPTLQTATTEQRRNADFADESADRLPEWPERPVARQAGANVQTLPASLHGAPAAIEPGCEPIPLVDPPLLRTPPVDGAYEARMESHRGLTIPQISICRQVRGFEDVVTLDAQRLKQGQPVLIYATLEGFRSMATSKGYRTLTLSTLEIQSPEGELLQRQSLGPAVDLVEIPRRDFFLTHLVTIPGDLPAGDYVFKLCVDDLLKHESAHARIAVRITEDRGPRDGMAGTSGSATHPSGFRR